MRRTARILFCVSSSRLRTAATDSLSTDMPFRQYGYLFRPSAQLSILSDWINNRDKAIVWTISNNWKLRSLNIQRSFSIWEFYTIYFIIPFYLFHLSFLFFYLILLPHLESEAEAEPYNTFLIFCYSCTAHFLRFFVSSSSSWLQSITQCQSKCLWPPIHTWNGEDNGSLW